MKRFLRWKKDLEGQNSTVKAVCYMYCQMCAYWAEINYERGIVVMTNHERGAAITQATNQQHNLRRFSIAENSKISLLTQWPPTQNNSWLHKNVVVLAVQYFPKRSIAIRVQPWWDFAARWETLRKQAAAPVPLDKQSRQCKFLQGLSLVLEKTPRKMKLLAFLRWLSHLSWQAPALSRKIPTKPAHLRTTLRPSCHLTKTSQISEPTMCNLVTASLSTETTEDKTMIRPWAFGWHEWMVTEILTTSCVTLRGFTVQTASLLIHSSDRRSPA